MELQPILSSIEDQCRRTPDAVAVTFEGSGLTFAELDHRAERLAARLHRFGVRPESLVALCLPRGLDLAVTLVAIWKAGGAYVPLDPGYPVERLRYMLSDAEPVVLVVDTTERADALLGDITWRPGEVVCLDRDRDAILAEELSGELSGGRERAALDNLAYMIYTSGSTGRPKGVLLNHRQVANYLDWKRDLLRPDSSDAVLLRTPISFDPSVWELFLPMMTGARLVIPRQDGHRELTYLSALIERERVTIAQFVPSLLRMFLDGADLAACKGLRAVVSGGEELPSAVGDRFTDELDADFYNVYGPTETTIFSTCARYRRGEVPVSIGDAVPGNSLHVLDEDGNPVPPGTPGELYIGGVAVCRGYHRRAGLTAERFVPDPTTHGGRRYRTGDLVRQRPDGELDYLGRIDNQLKVNGVRVEAGEIEAAIRTHPLVTEAVVRNHVSSDGTSSLVAYVTTTGGTLDGASLRTHLADLLPAMVIPQLCVTLEAFPLSPAGKIDRKALPAPVVTARAYVAPVTDTERALAGIWESVLKAGRVGRTDHFLDIGGNSIAGMRIITRIARQLGIALTLPELLGCGTVAELASLVAGRDQGQADEPVALPRDGRPLPLSFAQEQLWFVDGLQDQGGAYNVAMALRLNGSLDVEVLRRSFADVVRRHETLRTTFHTAEGRPRLRVHPEVTVTIGVEPVSPADVEPLLADEVARPFDLAELPLFRVRLLRTAPEEHVLVVVLHHIISDGMSLDVLARELSTGALPAPALQYADFAAWQRERFSDDALAHWQSTLDGAPLTLELPTELVRPAVQDFTGATISFTVDERVRELARAENVTLFMVLLAAYQALLARYTGQRDVLVGSPVSGRGLVDLEPLIGLFVNTVVFRTRIEGDPSFRALLATVRDVTLDAYAHQDVPFERLVEAIARERDLARHPLVQALFVIETDPAHSFTAPGLTATSIPVPSAAVKCDLRLAVEDHGGPLAATLQFDTSVVTVEWARTFVEHWLLLLDAVTRNPDVAVLRTPLCPPEHQSVIDAANDTAADVGYVDVWDQVAAQEPDRLAVTCGGDTLTYRELGARVEGVAAQLIQAGAGPETLVGVRLPRGTDLVVALLAVWRAGAGVVALDPGNPTAAVLPDLVVTESMLRDATGHCPPVPSLPDSIAYVVHTSGSSGVPKGIAGTRRGVANYFADMRRRGYAGPGDVVVAMTTVTFDACLRDLVFPLTVGARVVVMPEGAQDLVAVAETMAAERVTAVLAIVPSLLRVLTAHLARTRTTLPLLHTVLVSGEPLRPGDVMDVAAVAPSARVVNMYGPSETTMTTTMHEAMADDGQIPIGRPILNTRIELLDDALQPVGIGIPGDVYIAGAGLTRGYHGRPGLTAERFVPHPVLPGQRLYRTGDRARYLPDGSLHYLGRTDDQLKVNGVRVDPADVEAALLTHPSIARAAVTVRGHLVAYVVASPEWTVPGTAALRAHLATLLPHTLIPSSFVVLADLPATASGKVDRLALPDPPAVTGGRAPGTETERILADIWRDVLDVDVVGADVNYFAIGGDSVRSIQIAARAAEHGLRLAPRQFFQHQTIAELALVASRDVIAFEDTGEDTYPLSHTQAGILFHVLAEPDRGLYISQTVWRDERVDVDHVTRAWTELLDRHPVLRTRVDHDQQVVERHVAAPVTVVDGSAWPVTERRDRLTALLAEDRRAGFDLSRAPLWRCTLVDFGDKNWTVVFTSHHLLLDGWSIVRLVDEFDTVHTAVRAGEPVPHDPVPSWGSYLSWLSTQDPAEAEPFWRQYLDGFHEPTRLLPHLPTGTDQGHAQCERVLSADIGARLTRFTRTHRLTVNTVLRAVWGLLLARYTGSDDVVFGATLSGRTTAPDTTRMLGMFINTLPVRITVPDHDDVVGWLREIQRRQGELPAEHTPLAQVHGWSAVPGNVPLFDTILVVENYPMREALRRRLGDDDPTVVSAKTWTNYPFTLVVTPGDEIRAEAVFDRRRYDEQIVAQILANFEAVLDQLMGDDDAVH